MKNKLKMLAISNLLPKNPKQNKTPQKNPTSVIKTDNVPMQCFNGMKINVKNLAGINYQNFK